MRNIAKEKSLILIKIYRHVFYELKVSIKSEWNKSIEYKISKCDKFDF